MLRHTRLHLTRLKDVVFVMCCFMSTRIIPVSEAVKRDLSAVTFFSQKLHVPLLSWDFNLSKSPRCNPPAISSPLKIAVISRISAEKNLQHLVFLAKKLRNKAVIEVFGSGPLLDALMRQAKLENADNLIFHGFEFNVREAIKNSDVVLHTSLAEGGFPLAIIDAVAMRKPVVCSNKVETVQEILDENEHYSIDVNDLDGLAYFFHNFKRADGRIVGTKAWRKFANKRSRRLVMTEVSELVRD